MLNRRELYESQYLAMMTCTGVLREILHESGVCILVLLLTCGPVISGALLSV